jgi:rubrerythrin
MNYRDLAEKLGKLMRLDGDTMHAYIRAIRGSETASVRETLSNFRDDHERHIGELSFAIRNLGESPPRYSRDFRGFLIEGLTAVRSMAGTKGALKAMRTNEQFTKRRYNEALSLDLPDDVRDVVERSYEDERRHLAYIEQALINRVWERGATTRS